MGLFRRDPKKKFLTGYIDSYISSDGSFEVVQHVEWYLRDLISVKGWFSEPDVKSIEELTDSLKRVNVPYKYYNHEKYNIIPEHVEVVIYSLDFTGKFFGIHNIIIHISENDKITTCGFLHSSYGVDNIEKRMLGFVMVCEDVVVPVENVSGDEFIFNFKGEKISSKSPKFEKVLKWILHCRTSSGDTIDFLSYKF